MINLLKDGSFMGFSIFYLVIGLVFLASGSIVAIVAMLAFREQFILALQPWFLQALIASLTLLPFFATIVLSKVFSHRPMALPPNILVEEPPIEVSYREVQAGRSITEQGDF